MNSEGKWKKATAWLLCTVLLIGCAGSDNRGTEESTSQKNVKRESGDEPGSNDTRNAEKEPVEKKGDKGILIALDPGHQSLDAGMTGLEQYAPGSPILKEKAAEGTVGVYSHIPEYELNLDISLMLRTELEDMGYDVVMTREDNNISVSYAERARFANDAGADITVRIQANSSDNPKADGASVLIGSAENLYVGELYEDSLSLGTEVLDSYCRETGMKNLGVQTDDMMTSINWSSVPVIVLEMGYMTNKQDDENMADQNYRTKMVNGIAEGINAYFEERNIEEPETAETEEMEENIRSVIDGEKQKGTLVSVYAEKFGTDETASVDSGPMESASLIKLYVAGCVYEHMDEMNSSESYENETKDLIKNMISASDNNATNTLVTRLGDGDPKNGMEMVNQFCAGHGYTDTSMGRLMLDFDSESDNYTSVRDCGKYLKDIYNNNLTGSDEILEFLKAQERTSKIPAGVPTGVTTANKTGELDDVENDAAIIFGDNGTYVLCVMMNSLQDAAGGRAVITELSAMVYDYMQSH